jgi:hypothetical protein
MIGLPFATESTTSNVPSYMAVLLPSAYDWRERERERECVCVCVKRNCLPAQFESAAEDLEQHWELVTRLCPRRTLDVDSEAVLACIPYSLEYGRIHDDP